MTTYTQIYTPARREEYQIGPIPTHTTILGILSSLVVMGAAAGLGRLFIGLGATTSLTDGYPWGIWIGFDFTLIALAGAGFTLAAVVHVFHLHRFQPVLRPALLTGLLGYVAVLLLLVIDLGRPDKFYSFIINWNMHSPLFEISWCVLLYSTVLAIEVSPDLFRRLGWDRFRRWALAIMTPVSILGVTLSTLHQSTLGTLYLNMPHRLDVLWYTPVLPLLFYVSSIMAGLSVAMLVYRLACGIQGVAEKPEIGRGLGVGVACIGLLYLAIKLGELAWRGQLAQLWSGEYLPGLMLAELGLGVAIPALLMLIPALGHRSGVQTLAAGLVIGGVMLNRFDATLFAQTPTLTGFTYTPHILEWLTTVGILAAAALVWYVGVQYLDYLKLPDHDH